MAAAFQQDAFQNDAFEVDAGTNASAGVATGTGSAHNAAVSLACGPSAASGTGEAFGATVSSGTFDLSGTGSISQTQTLVLSGKKGGLGTGTISVTPSLTISTTIARSGTGLISITPSLTLSATTARSGSGSIAQGHYTILRSPSKRTNVQIVYDGTDITDICVLNEARFTSRSGGQAGQAEIGIKDTAQAWDLLPGKTLELYLDGRREWDGWVVDRKQAYWFEGTPQGLKPRHTTLVGADRNLLFQRRVMFNKAAPEQAVDNSWPAGTMDRTVILNSISHYIDPTDGIDYSTRVDEVAAVDPYQPFKVPGPSQYLGDLLGSIARDVGTVFYIDPDRYLVYTDVNESDAPFGISDIPDPGEEVGIREVTLLRDGSNMVNDAMIWGAGLGSDSMVFSRVQDPTSIAEHGRWQNQGGFRSGVWKQASSDRIADSIVYGSPANRRGHKDDAVTVTCSLFEPGLRVGYKVPVFLYMLDFEDVIPIREMTITFPTPDRARYDLRLSHELDAPWSVIDPWRPPDRPDRCQPVTCQITGLPENVCVDDTFQGTTSAGTGWGTADTGQVWGVTGGNSTTNVVANGDARLLSVGGGTSTTSLSASSTLTPLCAPDGSDATLLAHFTVSSASAWTSSQPYSQAATGLGAAIEGAYNAPGVQTDPEEPDNSLESGLARQYLQINTGGAAFGTYVRIYNAAGSMWMAAKYQNSAFQVRPIALGSATEDFWVKMRVTGDGQLLIKAWDDDDPEPGWLISQPNREWSGDLNVAAVFHTNNATTSANIIRCHEFHVTTLNYSGSETISTEGTDGIERPICLPIHACGEVCITPIFDHCTTVPAQCIETFTRTVVDGLGDAEVPEGNTWSPNSDYFSVLSTQAIFQTGTDQEYVSISPSGMSGPLDIKFLIKFERDVGATAGAGGWGQAAFILDTPGGPGSPPIEQPYIAIRFHFTDGVTFGVADGLTVFRDVHNGTSLSSTSIGSLSGAGLDLNFIRLRYVPNTAPGNGFVMLKRWAYTDPEPSTWDLGGSSSSFFDPLPDEWTRWSMFVTPPGVLREMRPGVRMYMLEYEVLEPCDATAQECYYRTTIPYTPGTSSLFMSGVHLIPGTDYEEVPETGMVKMLTEVTGPLYWCFEGAGQTTFMLPDTGTGLFNLPISGGSISGTFGPQVSTWGPAVWHGQYYEHFHNGVDFSVSIGTPVYAAAAGTASLETQAAGGTMVHIFHSNGMRTTYAHLSSQEVVSGENVAQGQLIGYSGDTGNVTGPHLHWGMVWNGSPEDPTAYL